MATDFNAGLTDVRTHEAKLTVSSGRMAQFAYDSTAYQDDTAEGTATYNYGNHQNIPLGNAGTLNVDGQILDKGVRSQASSITRMMLNHFFGRASYNVNKMADYMKAMLDTLLVFMREGSNAWSPTTSYVAGDLVYYVHTINGVSTKRTFFCKEASTNKPPVDATTGALINTSYWGEINVGNTTINGDLNVNGNIYQNGSAYETHAEKIFTKKDMIYTREGAVSGLVTNALTGITGLLYDGVHNGVLGFDNLGTARVGDEGDEQPLLTRAESNALANGHILVWDETNKRAVDGGSIIDRIYPIGSIYQNAENANNPSDPSLLGEGTWIQITDAYLACRGANHIGASGGAWGYTLTEANIPQHNHGSNTGGAVANITSATHSHYHFVDASHGHLATTSVGIRSTQCYGSGSGSGGLVKDDSHLAGGSTSYIWAEGVSTTVDRETVHVNSGDASNTNVSITQGYHSHTIGNYGSASPTAISIMPTYVGVYTWKRVQPA